MVAEQRATILVVDDDARSREIVRAYLPPAYDVVDASCGAAALERLAQPGIDLVILDLMMPGEDGFSVCRAIKALPGPDFLPVLLLTALGDQEHKNSGLAAGADEFLAKPVDRLELRLRASAFLAIRAQQRTIQRQLVELRRLEALKDDLASLVVHDLRNPLQNLATNLQLLELQLERRNLERVSSSLGGCFRSVQRLDQLLTDVLQVRMLEQGALSLQRVPARVAELVDAAAGTLDALLAQQSVSVRNHVDGGLEATMDPRLLRRALENVLANALSFSPAGETIDVYALRVGPEIEIEIADRGPGVPDGYKQLIFEKFAGVRSPQTSPGRKTHGLGLFFVRLVAQAHGGSVSVRDREGGGSVFRLSVRGDGIGG